MTRRSNFHRLISRLDPGKDFRRQITARESPVIILALHGGGIEPGTAKLASGIAGSEYSLYVFEGTRLKNNWELHLPSTRFDDPQCLTLVERTPVALSLHGCRGDMQVTYIGGRHLQYASAIQRSLTRYGFLAEPVQDRHAGLHPENICNRCLFQRGVQLELSRALRKAFFRTLDREGRKHTTEAFHTFVSAVREGISSFDISG